MPSSQSATNIYVRRKEADMKNTQYVILYERLSRDDELQGTSNSILNQQQLLQEYAERNNLTPYIHINDDGYSGTGWNRPGWQKIIEEIEAGNVSTLVIKDLSRMGRDHLRVGLYMEMFRDKGIRLIGVNDGIDTSRGEDDFTPFRAIMAEWYARDTSRKIKSVINAKGRSGKPTSNNAPYGFVKDPNDKDKWIIDPESAAVVRRIFQMAYEGMGPFQIARELTLDKVERPSCYLGTRDLGKHRSDYNEERAYTWRDATVVNILSRPEYCGHTVNFRTRCEDFKSKKKTFLPPEEWLIFENTHDAIVSQEVFDTVQKLRRTPRRLNKFGETNPLTGLLFCADCNAKLYNYRKAEGTRMKDGKSYKVTAVDVYQCSTHKLGTCLFGNSCSLHHIKTEAVRNIILDVLQRTGGYVREHEAEFVELVRSQSSVKQGEAAKSYKRQISKNEKRIAELNQIFRSLYEDKALGKISEEKFDELVVGYEQEQVDLKEKTVVLQAELDEFNADSVRADKFVELIHKYTRFEELTNAMINSFVDKIVVHESIWSEQKPNHEYTRNQHKGTRSQQVEVYLKYIGKIDIPDARTSEEIEAERLVEEKAERERSRKREVARQRRAKKKEAALANTPTSSAELIESVPKQKRKIAI